MHSKKSQKLSSNSLSKTKLKTDKQEKKSKESGAKVTESSRASLLIQDYLEFKAARCIQRFARGWLYRTKFRHKRLAAIKIQSEWRRFHGQRIYFRKYEEFLQHRIEQHFHRSAQRIQAFWRGWWVRHHIHDHRRLMRLQLLAGEDLLYCVAFKLHHLLRTHQIPGVYSLRNSSALSKVEQLLASLKFKMFNQQSIQTIEQGRRELEKARKQHKKSAYGTKIPFTGPNINNICDLRCSPIYKMKDADLRMTKILQVYEEASREISKTKILKKTLALSKQSSATIMPISKSTLFCDDVVKSMKKWKIITENHFSVGSNVFKNPENVESFLTEIQSKLSLLQDNCYCRQEFLEYLNKRKAKYFSDKGYIDQKQSPLTAKDNEQKSLAAILSLSRDNVPKYSVISSVVLTIDQAKYFVKKASFKSKEHSSYAKKRTSKNYSEESATSNDLT